MYGKLVLLRECCTKNLSPMCSVRLCTTIFLYTMWVTNTYPRLRMMSPFTIKLHFHSIIHENGKTLEYKVTYVPKWWKTNFVEFLNSYLKKNSLYDFLFVVLTLFPNYFSEINTNGNDEWFWFFNFVFTHLLRYSKVVGKWIEHNSE